MKWKNRNFDNIPFYDALRYKNTKGAPTVIWKKGNLSIILIILYFAYYLLI